MILRSTKKFFQKTFETVRSFLSGPTYQKLPKDCSTPSPFVSSYSCSNHVNAFPQDSCTDLDRFYADFSDLWDAGKTKKRNGRKKKKKKAESKVNVESQEKEAQSKNDAIIHHFDGRKEDRRRHPSTGNASAHLEARPDPHQESKSFRDRRSCSVARKLKELEMMDASNVDHVLDIEEVLYYYSLLTCPAYVDIVDKFFTEMCAELSGATTLGSSQSSRVGEWTAGGLPRP